MDREPPAPHIEVRPIDLGPARRETVDFDGSGPRRPLPGAVKWVAGIAILVAALIFYTHRQAAPPPAAVPPPVVFISGLGTPDDPIVVKVGHPLLGVRGNWELFARTNDSILRFQMKLGRITETSVPALNSSGPAALLTTSRAAVVVALDKVPGWAVPDGQPAVILPFGLHPDGVPIPGPDPDHFWVFDTAEKHMILVDTTGTPTGPTIGLPADADVNGVFPDGSGYVLVMTPHAAYDLRPKAKTLVSTGDVLATGPTGWLIGTCDQQQKCTATMVDRASGKRHRAGEYSYPAPATPGVVSANGHSAALLATNAEGSASVVLINVRTGRTRILNLAVDGSATDNLAFSPDGTWLFVANGDITPIDVATAKAQPFNQWGDILQLAIRPD